MTFLVIVTSWMPDGECAAPRLPVPFFVCAE